MSQASKDHAGKIQSLLFIYGEPISKNRLKKLLDLSDEDFDAAVELLKANLQESSLALSLTHIEDKFQLTTKPEYATLLQSVLKAEMNDALSPAALETLAIVCYSAPVSRAHIDYIRGVNSSFILKNLLIRGLIERRTDPANKNSFLYKPSFDLLKYLGITELKELPEYEKFFALAKNLNEQGAEQENE